MTADTEKLNVLSERLWKKGIAAFSATTLSAPSLELENAVHRLGAWIRSGSAPGARPLGIHLEGPFVNSEAAGAHPRGILRPLTLSELNHLWKASEETLQILTLAPECLSPKLLSDVTRWARQRKVRLSIGHTRCTQKQAETAFQAGFTGITHAWNAISYHHREAGGLGAAFGKKDVWIEIIPDGIHTSPTLIDWTLALHPEGTFFVSDAAPAAGTDGSSFHPFGGIQCRYEGKASRLPDGSLAGGGMLLSEIFRDWVNHSAKQTQAPPLKVLKEHLFRITELPLKALFFSPAERRRLLEAFPMTWELSSRNASVVFTPSPRNQEKIPKKPGKKGPAARGST
jgi:N-acetylglucosamine-6-phosphate deacetylase